MYRTVEEALESVFEADLKTPRVSDGDARVAAIGGGHEPLLTRLRPTLSPRKSAAVSIIVKPLVLVQKETEVLMQVEKLRLSWVMKQRRLVNCALQDLTASMSGYTAEGLAVALQLGPALEVSGNNSLRNIVTWARLCVFIRIAAVSFPVPASAVRFSRHAAIDQAVKSAVGLSSSYLVSGAVLLRLLDVLLNLPCADGKNVLELMQHEMQLIPARYRPPVLASASDVWQLLGDYLTKKSAVSLRRVEALTASSVARGLTSVVRQLLTELGDLEPLRNKIELLCAELTAYSTTYHLNDARNAAVHALPPSLHDVAVAMAFSPLYQKGSWTSQAVRSCLILQEATSGVVTEPVAWDHVCDVLASETDPATIKTAIATSKQMKLHQSYKQKLDVQHNEFINLCKAVELRCLQQVERINNTPHCNDITWPTVTPSASMSRLSRLWVSRGAAAALAAVTALAAAGDSPCAAAASQELCPGRLVAGVGAAPHGDAGGAAWRRRRAGRVIVGVASGGRGCGVSGSGGGGGCWDSAARRRWWMRRCRPVTARGVPCCAGRKR